MTRWWLTSMFIVAFISGSASATPVVAPLSAVIIPLNELVGEVTFTPVSQGQEVAFDAHTQFTSIESVSIEIKARVKAREFDSCGTVFVPQPCVHVIRQLELYAHLDKEDTPVVGAIRSELLRFSDSHVLEAYGIDTAPFRNTRFGWDFLLDGRGKITVVWNNEVYPDRIVRNVVEASGEIISANLIIQGTPIPESSSAISVFIGLLALSIRRHYDHADKH